MNRQTSITKAEKDIPQIHANWQRGGVSARLALLASLFRPPSFICSEVTHIESAGNRSQEGVKMGGNEREKRAISVASYC